MYFFTFVFGVKIAELDLFYFICFSFVVPVNSSKGGVPARRRAEAADGPG